MHVRCRVVLCSLVGHAAMLRDRSPNGHLPSRHQAREHSGVVSRNGQGEPSREFVLHPHGPCVVGGRDARACVCVCGHDLFVHASPSVSICVRVRPSLSQLADFGVAHKFRSRPGPLGDRCNHDWLQNTEGTVMFMSPECCTGVCSKICGGGGGWWCPPASVRMRHTSVAQFSSFAWPPVLFTACGMCLCLPVCHCR
jgi:hypothetical protein